MVGINNILEAIAKKLNGNNTTIDNASDITPPNVQPAFDYPGYYKTKLFLLNKPINTDPRFLVLYHYSVDRDLFGHWKYFSVVEDETNLEEAAAENPEQLNCKNLKSTEDNIVYVPEGNSYLVISEDNLKLLRRKMLNLNPKIPVILLNIKCDMKLIQVDGDSITGSGDIRRWESFMTAHAGYYQSLIALTFSEVTDLLEHTQNLEEGLTINSYLNKLENPTEKDLVYPKLRTDFWKHGAAGIIDIQETIKPCMWYGKQHPFEFEFIAGNSTAYYKRFDSVLLLTNNVLPESIHYTIIGDAYSFSKDKRNMYFRQEATKAFYQKNGSDILYDHDAFTSDFRNAVKQTVVNNYLDKDNSGNYIRHKSTQSDVYKSTILPLVYSRQDTFNEIEDFYKKALSPYHSYDYTNLSGGEIVYNKRENNFNIQNHVKIRDIKSAGRIRGNAEFKNDCWSILISPLRIYLANENWPSVPPINLSNAPVPEDMYPVRLRFDENNNLEIQDKSALELLDTNGKETIPNSDAEEGWTNDLKKYVPAEVYNCGYTTTSNLDPSLWTEIYSNSTETRLIGSYIKVRLRYDGSLLVLAKAVNTVFEPKI